MNKKGRLSYVLLTINTIPLILFGVILLGLGSGWLGKAMYGEVQSELKNMANGFVTMFDALYPGDYELVGDSALRVYKGPKDLTGDYTLMDEMKVRTGMDFTLFYKDTRILTTLVNSEGVRIVGSGASEPVLKEVLSTGQGMFYSNVLIYGKSYSAFYLPLQNADGQTVGMLSVCKLTDQLKASIQNTMLPLSVASSVVILIICLLVWMYTNGIVQDLLSIKHFLGRISGGELKATLPQHVLSRNDELGDISRSALEMQHSLHLLVNQDALTTLPNRRSGDKQLKQSAAQASQAHRPFCVCIGDIDFFKKVNDTYGHDCGDLILKNVALTLKQHMHGNGTVARWGGEEFLFIFDHTNFEESRQILEDTLSDIRAMESAYGDQIVKVTMSFGLTDAFSYDVGMLLKKADENLYTAKTSGRNQVYGTRNEVGESS